AALPLYAKVDPVRAGGEVLAPLIDDKNLDANTKIAAALAWGEVAKAGGKDNVGAANAAGMAGSKYMETLRKMAKQDNYVARLGAARGLQHAAEVNANLTSLA